MAASADLVLFSPVVLPSGTLVSARVEESFENASEGELRTEPFTQELPLFRFPALTPTASSTETFPSGPPTPRCSRTS